MAEGTYNYQMATSTELALQQRIAALEAALAQGADVLRDALALQLMPAKERKARERDTLDRCLLFLDFASGRPPSLVQERVDELGWELLATRAGADAGAGRV